LRRFERALTGDRDVAFLAALGEYDAEFQERVLRLQDDLAAVIAANEPAVLAEDAPERLREIADTYKWVDLQGHEHPLIEEKELLALSVKRGSLTDKERVEIESHVSHTYKFLSLMPWTKQFSQLALIAGAHHERLNGTGYPRKLTADEIPIQSKMMAIADIYDALTASDRPYKKAVPVDKALDILHQEAAAEHIDRELLDIFVKRRVFDIAVEVTMRQAKQQAPLAGSRA
jgi:hypothetical protein